MYRNNFWCQICLFENVIVNYFVHLHLLRCSLVAFLCFFVICICSLCSFHVTSSFFLVVGLPMCTSFSLWAYAWIKIDWLTDWLQSTVFDIVSLSRSSGVFYAKLCLDVGYIRVLYFSIMSYFHHISSIYDIPYDFVLQYCLFVRCCMNCCKTVIIHVSSFQLRHTAGDSSWQETQLSLTNRATRLEVSQAHQTWYVRYGFLLACYSNFVRKTYRFWNNRLQNAVTVKTGIAVCEGHWNVTIR